MKKIHICKKFNNKKDIPEKKPFIVRCPESNANKYILKQTFDPRYISGYDMPTSSDSVHAYIFARSAFAFLEDPLLFVYIFTS